MANTERTRWRALRWSVWVCCLLTGWVHAQTLREESPLFDKPDGKPGAVKIKSGTPVKALKRQGFWVEVDAEGKTGWLKASQLNFAGATGGPTAIDTGRLGTGNIVATSAARGLSAKDLVSGQPNFNEASKLDALAVTPQAAQAFMVAGGLQPVSEKVQLTAPKPASTAVPATSGAPSATGVTPTKKKGDDDW